MINSSSFILNKDIKNGFYILIINVKFKDFQVEQYVL